MNYNALESLLIANEGLFDKYKEKKAAKKAAKYQAQREYAEWVENYKKIETSYIIPELNKVLAKVKLKHSKYNLPWDIKIISLGGKEPGIEIEIFKDEWCMNEFNDNYDPNAMPAFDECLSVVEEWCKKNSNTNKCAGLEINAEVVENNSISISIDKV